MRAARFVATAMVAALGCAACGGDDRGSLPDGSASGSTASSYAGSTPAVAAPVFTLAWSVPLAGAPAGIVGVIDSVAAAPDGTVFVVEAAKTHVLHLGADGTVLNSWGEPGAGPGQFNFQRTRETVLLSGIATDRQGDVYVTESGNARIQKFAPDGTLISSWGKAGPGEGTFLRLIGVAVDAQGFVYASDGDGPFTVQKFDPSGAFVLEFAEKGTGADQIRGEGGAPAGLAADGTVYVPDNKRGAVLVFGSDGTFRSQFGSQAAALGGLSGPGQASVAADGTVFVADSGNRRLVAFDAQGNFLWSSTGAADGVGHVKGVYGVAIGPSGMVYVIDSTQQLLLAFTLTG